MNQYSSKQPLFKCLDVGAQSVHRYPGNDGDISWSAPRYVNGAWCAGAWKEMSGRSVLKPHSGGLHLTPQSFLICWLRPEIYQAEIDTSKRVEFSMDCVVAERARLVQKIEIPDYVYRDLSYSWGALSLQVFKALNYPWDIVRRLEIGIDLVGENKGYDKYKREWSDVKAVVEHCHKDSSSGFETNLNTRAGFYAAQAIGCLGAIGIGKDWQVAKEVCHNLGHAMSGLVEDVVFRHGTQSFDKKLAPQIVHNFLPSDMGESNVTLPHAVRRNTLNYCNQILWNRILVHNKSLE